jgi:hypothetical protein
VKEKKIKGGGNKKYRVHPYFNRSGELGSPVAARKPDQDSATYGSFYRITRTKF